MENMDALNDLLKSFVTQSQKVLGYNLIGIYLHGSAVMGCYNEKKSDIDLLVVVNEAVPNNIKFRFMDMVVELNTYAPPKGIEMSIVKREVCGYWRNLSIGGVYTVANSASKSQNRS